LGSNSVVHGFGSVRITICGLMPTTSPGATTSKVLSTGPVPAPSETTSPTSITARAPVGASAIAAAMPRRRNGR
jgi:hypothetical protein